MNTVTTRRLTDDQGTVWFAVGVGADYLAAAERLLMDYERQGAEWRRGYASDTQNLELAWQNFAVRIEQVLRQAARREPIPWQEALRELCRRTGGGAGGLAGERDSRIDWVAAGDRPVRWWLTGSAALAVRGAPIEPGDLDLVCEPDEAIALSTF